MSAKTPKRATRRVSSKEFNDFANGEKDLMLDIVKDEAIGSETGLLIARSREPRLENTFKTDPDRFFPYCKARKIIEKVLSSLEEVQYSSDGCAKLATELSDQIRIQVKQVSPPRYKVSVIVHVGERDDQALVMGSRCLWNPDFDTFTSASFKSPSLFAVGLVFACYFE